MSVESISVKYKMQENKDGVANRRKMGWKTQAWSKNLLWIIGSAGT